MCLIAVTPHEDATKFLTPFEEESARLINADGIGSMWIDGGRVHVRKGLGERIYRPALGVRYAVHWRYATSGNADRVGCHPHVVMSKSWGDPYDLALMHNGVFHWLSSATQEVSDTMLWVRHVLRPMLRKSPGWLADGLSPFWNQVVDDVERSGSKVLFAGSTVGWIAWPMLSDWPCSEDGAHVSNLYSIQTEAVEDYSDLPRDPWEYPAWWLGDGEEHGFRPGMYAAE